MCTVKQLCLIFVCDFEQTLHFVILISFQHVVVLCTASSIDRSKLSGTSTSFQPRPAIVGHAPHPTPSPLAAAVAASGMRTLLPINTSRPVALPIVRWSNRLFTRSCGVAKSVGCYQRHLFVCLFVNTITVERVNIGWWNLGVGALYKNPGIVRIWGSYPPGCAPPKMWCRATTLEKSAQAF